MGDSDSVGSVGKHVSGTSVHPTRRRRERRWLMISVSVRDPFTTLFNVMDDLPSLLTKAHSRT